MHAGSVDGVVILSEAECTKRLVGARTGFLATTERALPVIVPVAITAAGNQLLLSPVLGAVIPNRTASGPARAIVALAVGSLEDDKDHDDGLEGAWSVVVQGVLNVMPDGPRSGACSFQPELMSGWRRHPVRVGS